MIGNTIEFRQKQYNEASDLEKRKFDREMQEWAEKHHFCAIMMSKLLFEKKVQMAEKIYDKFK